MKFTQKLKLLFKASAWDDYVKAFMRGDPVPVINGEIPITTQTAMKYSAVFACVRVLSETLAAMPIMLYRTKENGDRERRNDLSIYDILHNAPNAEMSPFNFKEAMMVALNTGGNAVCKKIFNGYGLLKGLYPYQWQNVQIDRDPVTRQLLYRINDGTKTEILTRNQVFHVPGLSFNGVTGLSPIEYTTSAIRLGLSYEQFGVNFYKNSANASGVFTHPGVLSDEAYKRLKENLKTNYAGLINTGTPMLFEEGLDFKPMSIKPADAQLIESKRFQTEDIARIYRVPLHLIQNLEKSSYSNIEMQSLEFVMYTMLPWFKRWEENMKMQLLTPTERKDGFYLEFKIDSLLRGDAKTRAEAYAAGRQWGWLSVNDIRRLENMNSIPNGDIYLQPMNMLEASKTQQQDQVKAMTEEIYKMITEKTQVLEQKMVDYLWINPFKDNMTPEEWQEEYEEGNAHWADDLQPSLFAQQFIDKLRSEEITGSLLEIGCGNGRDSIFFARAGFDVTAIDVAPAAIELAKENAKNAEVEIGFVEANAEELPFTDGQFNAVFSLSVLHASDMTKSIPETSRVLMPGGLFSTYIYGTTENVSGATEVYITIDDYINLLKTNNYEILDFYSEQEEDYDEAGERHQIIVALCRRLEDK